MPWGTSLRCSQQGPRASSEPPGDPEHRRLPQVPAPRTPSIPPCTPRGAAHSPLPRTGRTAPPGPLWVREPRTCSAPAASAWSSGTGLARGRPPALSGGCSGCSRSSCSWPSPPPAGPGCSGSGSESVCQVESQSSTVVGSRKLTPPSRLPIEEAAAGAGCGSALGPGHGRAPLASGAGGSSPGPRRTAQRGRRRSGAQAGRSRAPRGRRRTSPIPPMPPPPRPAPARPTHSGARWTSSTGTGPPPRSPGVARGQLLPRPLWVWIRPLGAPPSQAGCLILPRSERGRRHLHQQAGSAHTPAPNGGSKRKTN